MENSIAALAQRIRENIERVIVGRRDAVDLLLICLFGGGHILIEDVPGTGKTMLAKALAASVDCAARRIQFTPDLLPSDITGINFFNMKKSEFEFVPGPVFANILLADEINRATPKTQAGLLECMEERQTTIDGRVYKLASPFIVIATQNPVESMGVFPLPEAQLDRFLVKTSMKYPTREETAEVIARFGESNPLLSLKPVTDAEEVASAIRELPKIYAHPDLLAYITDIVFATRGYENVELGVSTRGALSLLTAAKGFAALSGRNYIRPDDVKAAAHPVLEHRLILSTSAKIRKNAAYDIIEEILSSIPVPTETGLGWSRR